MVSGASLLGRLPNFQWYWNSSANPWSSDTHSRDWSKYSDVENEIIEEGFTAKNEEVEVDGNYIISLKLLIQYNKLDTNKQRPIKRVIMDPNRRFEHLREERFSLPIASTATMLISTTGDDDNAITLKVTRDGPNFPDTYRHHIRNYDYSCSKNVADIVEEAALGILKEGNDIGKTCEAQWLAKELRNVKHFGDNIKLESGSRYPDYEKIPDEIGRKCVFLYTKECFWYKLINSTLRSIMYTVTPERLKTLGPFSFLLTNYLKEKTTTDIKTVYRGLILTNEQLQEYIDNRLLCFTAFTSTSVNRKKAAQFGNTLLIINLDVVCHYTSGVILARGANISSLSDFPDEEEFLIWPGTAFSFGHYEYDDAHHKHLIYITAVDTAP
ncbi:unnamed protein product [Rotaria sp. Silwood2]|nr:unnamed protein product [Rotaria sp. Silwood2]